MCKHRTCSEIRTARSNLGKTGDGGVGVVLLNNYYSRGNYAIFLGKERGGKYKNEYNLCAGGVEQIDNSCYIEAAKRELREEFKIDIQDYKDFDKIFKNTSGRVRYIMHHSTPIFIGVISSIKRGDLNKKIQDDNNNKTLSHSYHEMDRVDYFWLNGSQIDGQQYVISKFASSVMKKIDVNNL